jgi:hypothetical protein
MLFAQLSKKSTNNNVNLYDIIIIGRNYNIKNKNCRKTSVYTNVNTCFKTYFIFSTVTPEKPNTTFALTGHSVVAVAV